MTRWLCGYNVEIWTVCLCFYSVCFVVRLALTLYAVLILNRHCKWNHLFRPNAITLTICKTQRHAIFSNIKQENRFWFISYQMQLNTMQSLYHSKHQINVPQWNIRYHCWSRSVVRPLCYQLPFSSLQYNFIFNLYFNIHQL